MDPTDLLFEPHHDGSPAYVSDESPALGSHVEVRVRTSPQRPVEEIWLRTVEDAEPFYAIMEQVSADEHTVWWRGAVHVRNPVQRYRFMLVAGGSFRWLTAAGVADHEVPDAFDFTLSTYAAAPDWGRDAIVYQVFPDRFARSAQAHEHPAPAWAKPAAWDDLPIHVGPDTPLQLYGGDLPGITEHLDHVTRVGADTVYLTPVFPAESNHRYNASTFERVDPLLGGDEAFRELIDGAHDRGLRVMGDLTSNHTGDTHEWFTTAREHPDSAERGFYFFTHDGGHEGWKGYATLPKLNHLDAGLEERFHDVVAHWLRFGLDGWRIDVANMTGRHAAVDVAHRVAHAIRRTATSVRPDAHIVAEHGHDASGDLDGDGWPGTMNYYGFSFPVWEFLRTPEGHVPSFGWPVGLPRRTGGQAVRSMREFTARFGWRAVTQSWNILGSHDSPRIRTVTGSAAGHHAAIALQFTLPGVPMVFAGDELGLQGTDGEDSRRTMPWDTEADWDTTTLEEYARFAALRREHAALRRGGLRWLHVGDDLLVFLREHPDGDVLVAVSRGGSPALVLPAGQLPEEVTVPASDVPASWVWPLPHPSESRS